MIEIKGLTKKYGRQAVLRNVDMHIPDGCIYGIVGPSGVGKSTLLRCINALESYDDGSITVNGTDLKSLSPAETRKFRRETGMIFQNFALLERRTVLQNVAFPMECWKYDKARIQTRAVDLLERVGLKDKLYAMPSELSGGQKQRVAIARALALEPSVLLCDEATSALDPAITQSILELLVDINTELGITIVMVTHEMPVVKTACDRMAIFEGGSIVSQGLVEDVFLNDDAALQKLIGSKSIAAPLGKELVKVVFAGSEPDQKAIYNLALSSPIPFGVFCANVSPFRGSSYKGHIYLVTDDGNASQLAALLKEKGMTAQAGKVF